MKTTAQSGRNSRSAHSTTQDEPNGDGPTDEGSLQWQDGRSFWQFLSDSNIKYDKHHFPFLTTHTTPQFRQVFDFAEYLQLSSRGEALAYLYNGLGKSLNYVGPVLDLEREYGFNDHTDRHTLWVSQTATELLQRAGLSYNGNGPFDRTTEVLATLVGMTHDIGNFVSRKEHSKHSVRILEQLFVNIRRKPAWERVKYAILYHEEPVLRDYEVALSAGDPLQWALVAADKMHVGRDRVGGRSFTAGVKAGALEKDIHIFVNALIVRSTWYLGEQRFTWHLDFSVDQLEEKFGAFTKNGLRRLWVPSFVQRLFMREGRRYRDTFAQLFLEVYGDRLQMAAESVFLLFPFVQEFRVRLVDNDTRGKVGSGEVVVWQKRR